MDPITMMMIAQMASSAIGGLTDESGYQKVSNFDKNQKKLYGQMNQQLQQMQGQGGGYGNAMGLLQDYLNPESDVYKNFEAPYMQEFNQQTVPGLAERFAGFGAQGGGLSSSGFGQALGAAGANLQTNLAGMKSQMQRQSIGDIINQYNQLSNGVMNAQPYSYMDQGPGAMSNMFSAIGGMKNPFGASSGTSGAANAGGGNYQLMNQASKIYG